jgi:hypothetical protein
MLDSHAGLMASRDSLSVPICPDSAKARMADSSVSRKRDVPLDRLINLPDRFLVDLVKLARRYGVPVFGWVTVEFKFHLGSAVAFDSPKPSSPQLSPLGCWNTLIL